MLKRKNQVRGESDVANAQSDKPTRKKPLRLWPGVVIVVLQWLTLLASIVGPERIGKYLWFFGGFIGALLVVVWWVFFSRAHWFERIGAVVLMGVGLFVTQRILHESVARAGFGFQFFVYVIPVLSLALVVWAVASHRLADRSRRATMVATILIACGVFALLRNDGMTGDGRQVFTWRWTETAEGRLLAQADDDADVHGLGLRSAPAEAETEVEWPGFRGHGRDGIIHGVRIETDWSASPPVELWRRPIGPGISSFAVRGDLFYTQEQRGDDEIVSCYNLTTGRAVWKHRDAARFWDSHVGAGPRATPALSGGYVYTFGATGIVNALDSVDGAVIWSRNASSDTDEKVPYFGFTSSPLVVDDVVIVAAYSKLVAYDLATGEPRWFGPDGGWSPGSPHLLTLDGVPQILLPNGSSITSVAPADGSLLWQHSWRNDLYLQPALIPNSPGDLLFSASDDIGGIGMRRIGVTRGPGVWVVEERWTSRGLKPYFNDFVVHKGHAFGFDGRILACIDLEGGKRMWKGGRYGYGQLLLLADQDVLLVVSEKGELALVTASPDRFTELARFPAIEGRTWNHPVLVGDILLVRNGREMAAFRLPREGTGT